jgi:hypothetical protein
MLHLSVVPELRHAAVPWQACIILMATSISYNPQWP